MTGIIDADFSPYLGEVASSSLILMTDFSCMEMYAFRVGVIKKLLSMAFPKVASPPSKLLEAISPILQELFLIRLVNQSLQLELSWIPFETHIDINGAIIFKSSDFIRQYLAHNNATSRNAEFMKELKKQRQRLHKDPRHQINGHDLLALLSMIFRENYTTAREKERTRPEAILSSIRCCLDASYFVRQSLFRNLSTRLLAA